MKMSYLHTSWWSISVNAYRWSQWMHCFWGAGGLGLDGHDFLKDLYKMIVEIVWCVPRDPLFHCLEILRYNAGIE